MHISARSTLLSMAIAAGMTPSAQAADMTGAEIKLFLAGKTAYLETTAASAGGQAGQVVIYWADDGTALYKTPAGVVMHGKWEVKGNTNCTEWKERPNTGCVHRLWPGGSRRKPVSTSVRSAAAGRAVVS